MIGPYGATCEGVKATSEVQAQELLVTVGSEQIELVAPGPRRRHHVADPDLGSNFFLFFSSRLSSGMATSDLGMAAMHHGMGHR